ncbi:glycosyltransferase [Bacteroides ovatus]|nr:glycosyltransferase [Bacteroides ovatus]
MIENGINLKRFNPDGNRKDLRKEFGFTEDDFVIGFVSRITLQKAPLDFVKSIAIAHQKDARIKALLVGEGDMEEETKEAIRQNGIEEYIRTSPFRNDVPDVLHAINVFCLPSLWEGLSIALLEAMAMKKALVVTPYRRYQRSNHTSGKRIDCRFRSTGGVGGMLFDISPLSGMDRKLWKRSYGCHSGTFRQPTRITASHRSLL